ncbi:phosphate regulon sensor histidine kinase PhoR [Aestuariibacter halophilus]|uniref:histidine kinase n=1 Tax=Fluctibacter halophilus TaxID=226011 RepID=A0ABS8G8K8_9ALTE|nr:phosphate regulon sensor histidine kinase PhoR [Aestuariibacter halophilus]MCC2616431.1 phosphate regulon sensor histidine kinase PhoR [Aestuariibacter halophilus]
MYYPFSRSGTLLKLAAYFTLCAIFGAYVGHIGWAIALGAMCLLVLSYRQLFRLNHWLWHSKKMTPPVSEGLWSYIYEGIYVMQRRDRRKRKELSKMVKRFREGSEALPDATVVLDEDGAIVWCNKLARFSLGLRFPQDFGRRIDNLIRHPKFLDYFHAREFDKPIEVQSPLNQDKILEYRFIPYGDKQLLLIARDVTKFVQLEQMRRDFVANVSHELRTPLTVISGYLEMAPDDGQLPASVQQKAFKEMSSQAKRMQTLIEELLVLSRIEANVDQQFDNVVDVPSMLQTIATEANTLNREKQHEITFSVDPQLKVYGLETELRSAFSNLIFNAVHYTPAPGKIEVRWQLEGEDAVFRVRDNGEGIAAKHLSRLTERFYRVDKARSRRTGGSGLGLAIVKHVLSHHNSQLMIDSEVNVGSEFWFILSSELVATVSPQTLKQG